VYLTSLVVRRDPLVVEPARPDEVVAALRSRLSAGPPPEHHRIRHDGDRLTIVCFVAARSGDGAEDHVAAIRARVREVLGGHPGWLLEEEPAQAE
jgi:hypothetical protein